MHVSRGGYCGFQRNAAQSPYDELESIEALGDLGYDWSIMAPIRRYSLANRTDTARHCDRSIICALGTM